jgi:hypothetical protein
MKLICKVNAESIGFLKILLNNYIFIGINSFSHVETRYIHKPKIITIPALLSLTFSQGVMKCNASEGVIMCNCRYRAHD